MNKLYIVCGIPFSGKSTLVKEIEKRTGFVKVDLDDIKFELFGNDVKDPDLVQKDWDGVYQEMYRRIETLLKEGKTVVHDTGNFTKHERDLVRKIADRLNLKTVTIFVDTPKDIAYERLIKNRETKNRFDVADADFESTVAEMEIPDENENTLTFGYDQPVGVWIDSNIN